MKHIAIFSLTEQGRNRSQIIADALPEWNVQRYCFAKHCDENAEPFSDLAALTAAAFSRFDALIFVSACGIAVRMIAPYLRSKLTDPAVLAADDAGHFVIPLLSGHVGGANALAQKIGETTGSVPVITTATDAGAKFSPDTFAAANHLILDNPKAAKEIAAAVLDGERIGFRSAYPHSALPAPLTESGTPRCGILVSPAPNAAPFPVTLKLIPQNLVIGIGCKKGTSAEQITEAVQSFLNIFHLDFRRICAVSSIDLKENETGLLQFCEQYNLPFMVYSAAELMQVSGDFTSSAFVMHTTGADNICERSAVLCSGGKLVAQKYAKNGVTSALAEKNLMLDFERTIL